MAAEQKLKQPRPAAPRAKRASGSVEYTPPKSNHGGPAIGAAKVTAKAPKRGVR